MSTLKELPWYMWTLWLLVTVTALILSGWSMMTLGTQFLHMPLILASSASSIFDIAAMFLAVLSIYYAMSNKSGVVTELFAFGFMAISAWINWEHASILNYPTVGRVMFASFSIVSAVVLKSMLSYLTHQSRETHGRTVRHLPTVGVLTWILKPRQTWKLLQLALEHRVDSAWSNHVGQIETPVRTSSTLGRTPETNDSQLFSEADKIISDVRKPEITANATENPDLNFEIFENAKSGREIARIAVAENISDTELVHEIARRILGPETKRASIAKALSAAKKETTNA